MRLIIFVVLTVTVATAVPIEKIARKILGTAGFCFSLGHCSPVLAKVDDPKAMQRWQDAYTELQNLDKNWDKIVNDNRSGTNGDNIRRKLGTVYTPPTCESPLCSFSSFVNKFVKVCAVSSHA